MTIIIYELLLLLLLERVQ